jgi:hypothetical protein
MVADLLKDFIDTGHFGCASKPGSAQETDEKASPLLVPNAFILGDFRTP